MSYYSKNNNANVSTGSTLALMFIVLCVLIVMMNSCSILHLEMNST